MKPYSLKSCSLLKTFSALSLIFALTACSTGNVKDALGLRRPTPDAFKVISSPPLSVPPEFALRPPSDALSNLENSSLPARQSQTEAARSIIFGEDGIELTDTSTLSKHTRSTSKPIFDPDAAFIPELKFLSPEERFTRIEETLTTPAPSYSYTPGELALLGDSIDTTTPSKRNIRLQLEKDYEKSLSVTKEKTFLEKVTDFTQGKQEAQQPLVHATKERERITNSLPRPSAENVEVIETNNENTGLLNRLFGF